uniref:LDLR chaperone boca n=2 Tax=Tetranychus urticae TaxID=32264 RepID=T1KIH9_TETUR
MLFLILFTNLNCFCNGKKDIRDYNDADMERLFDEWEEKDDPLEPDELPEWKREPPKVDFSGFNFNNPEDVLKASKKGKTLMTFVTVYGKSTRQETEEITALWQTSLMNNHIIAERFIIDDNRAIFMFKDGSQAWEAKDFLVEQKYCDQVMIENKPYYGRYSPNKKDEL